MDFNPQGAPPPGNDEAVVLPLLPLRDIMVLPSAATQLFVGRTKSLAAVQAAMEGDKRLFLTAQKSPVTSDPTPADVYHTGTIGLIRQLQQLPDGTAKLQVEGIERASITAVVQQDPFFLAEVSPIHDVPSTDEKIDAVLRAVQVSFESYVKLNKKIQPEVLLRIRGLDDPSATVNTILAHMPSVKLADRQHVLELTDISERLNDLLRILNEEIEILRVERKIRTRVKRQMEKTQKEYYLNEQMQAIQRELGGEKDEFKSELDELEQRISNKKLSKEASERVRKELHKLKMMHPSSAEANVVRNYVDWILDLPWGEKTDEQFDLDRAERILDEDHYGLHKIKERIVEYLAVQALTHRLKGPILCFVGPPGVGKTSLAHSIARATGRKYVRLALGGVRDEAEIRGHRRTYIGALPGKIIQSLKKVRTDNPLFLLDEVDKMSSDFRGDPSAALLEVLDSEQNHAFNDHYLDLDYDLTDVMFITTANTLKGIPIPLQDRMEIVELSGYTEFEKLHIARKYLLPRQRMDAGLENVEVNVTDGALRTIIHHYTKEAGVRALEREIGSVCRKIAKSVVKGDSPERFDVAAKRIPKFLGVPKYLLTKAEDQDAIGLTNGLAVTMYGGDLLACEAIVLEGKGKLVVTGLLEKGMNESAQAAMSYIRSRSRELGLDTDFYQSKDVHVHFPEFIPKDGPSAGVTMATSIASALLDVPIHQDLAMTGELTLRGRVLPIGGVKEKLLAAHRAGITTVLMPKDNRKDLKEVPRRVLKAMRIVLVAHMDDVLREALCLEDPTTIFGLPKNVLEYRNGEMVDGSTDDHTRVGESRSVSP